MKEKPEAIRNIEKIFGFPLVETPENELGKPLFYPVSMAAYSRSYIDSPAFPYKGRRGYSMDVNNLVTGLSLDFCPVFLLPDSFWDSFRDIRFLSLRNSYLKDYSFIKNLKCLTSLDLRNTRLDDYSFISDLKGLTSLDLSYNNLSNFDFIKDLKGLTSIDLLKNSITVLPEWITDFQLQIDVDNEYPIHGSIALKDNPLENPPIETLRNGRDYIRRYFEEIKEQGLEYVWEAKLLLVGDGGVGKTTLAEKLEEQTAVLPPPDATTRGIKVRTLHFEFIVPVNHKQAGSNKLSPTMSGILAARPFTTPPTGFS